MRVVGTFLRGSKQACAGIARHSMPAQRVSYAGISQSARLAMLNRAYTTDSPPPPKDQPPKEEPAKNEETKKEETKKEAGTGAANSTSPESAKGKEEQEGRFPSRTFGGPEKRKERLFPATGPLSLPGISLFLLTAVGIYYYFTTEKERVRRERANKTKKVESIGTPEVGGAYELVDHDGNTVTDKAFHGKFHLVYFGFCHCPDICPDELDKIGDALDILDANSKTKDTVQPVFITCDPQRDSPEAVKEYLKQFHPKFIGLTGTVDQVRTACKAYRVYFSKPPKVADNQDYLVDHSIFSYLMDPDGTFVDVYGKDREAKYMAEDIARRIEIFRDAGRKL